MPSFAGPHFHDDGDDDNLFDNHAMQCNAACHHSQVLIITMMVMMIMHIILMQCNAMRSVTGQHHRVGDVI